jgi:hypothetical protein
MSRFNIVQIEPSGYVHAHALDEAAEYLTEMLRAAGQEAVHAHNHVETDAINVIVGGHLLADAHVDALPPSTIVFNSEQIGDPDNPLITPTYRRALASFRIWEYSPTNLPHHVHGRVTVIPFGDCPAMIRTARIRDEGDALVFHGAITPHRKRVLAALRDAGVRVETAFGEYGLERDLRMFRARAVLNLHKAPQTPQFEVIRCFYPLVNGIPVISEETADPSADSYRDIAWLMPADALAARVATLWRDPAAFRTEAAARIETFRARSVLPQIRAAIAQLTPVGT